MSMSHWQRSLKRLLGQRGDAQGLARSVPGRARPRLELLEDRCVPATLTVNTLADNATADSYLSMHEAVALIQNGGDANAALSRALTSGESNQVDAIQVFGSGDTVLFDNAIAGGTIYLSQGDTTFGPSAFAITTLLTIDGGSQGITLSGGGTQADYRLFYTTTYLSLINLTITNFSAH